MLGVFLELISPNWVLPMIVEEELLIHKDEHAPDPHRIKYLEAKPSTHNEGGCYEVLVYKITGGHEKILPQTTATML